MGKMPDALRETIARNIRECRVKKFPGRGGGKKCAESFGVSPQQWSPWESGKRTPDELRLEQIASFFSTTVEWFRRDHSADLAAAMGKSVTPHETGSTPVIHSQTFGESGDATPIASGPRAMPPLQNSEDEDIAHYLWVLDILTRKLTASGIRVVVTFERAAEKAANIFNTGKL